MKQLLTGIALFLCVSVVHAETVTRFENETTEAFVKRMCPTTECDLDHKVVESNVWGNGRKTLFIFYSESEGHSVDRNVVGHVYIPITTNTYQKILIDTFRVGYNTTIESVFFGNAKKDAERVLGIIVSGYYALSKSSGDQYSTYIYKPPTAKSIKLEALEEANKMFGFQCDCNSPYGNSKAKYKTAAEVKTKLKELGL